MFTGRRRRRCRSNGSGHWGSYWLNQVALTDPMDPTSAHRFQIKHSSTRPNPVHRVYLQINQLPINGPLTLLLACQSQSEFFNEFQMNKNWIDKPFSTWIWPLFTKIGTFLTILDLHLTGFDLKFVKIYGNETIFDLNLNVYDRKRSN